MMDNISEVGVLNSLPSREAMGFLSILHSFNRGWKRCQKQGNMYGDTSITRFKVNISEMFERGECEKGAKMNSEIMEVYLQRGYPDCYALPLVPNIKSYASHLINNKRTWKMI